MTELTLSDVAEFLKTETGLAVVSTTQANGDVLSSVVNCGVVDNPLTGVPSVAFVSRGPAVRLKHLRRGSKLTAAVRRDWAWRGITGPAHVIGPDDPSPEIDGEHLRLLLREVYQAAGGTHDDYDEYDRVMAEDRRAAVFIRPDRILGNG